MTTTRSGASEGSTPGESWVIYVHGVGQTLPAAELKLEWDLALFGADLGSRSRIAYWADLLQPAEKGRTRRLSRASRDDGRLDVDAALRAAGVAPGAESREFATGLLRSLGAGEEALAAGSARKKVIPLPGWARRPISRAFLEAFVGESAAYFFDDQLRKKIRQRLIDQLPANREQPVTIVAHSQGSIVAYEVLSLLKRGEIALDALVTLGSPLGLQEVQDYLQPPPAIPEVVERWHNFADPFDFVAFDKMLASDFRGAGGVVVQDTLLVNRNTSRFWNFNPHSAVGYLSHPDVRKVVNDAMRRDVMTRFVLARDVAERLGAMPEERHSVLIEVLEPGYPALGESREDETPRVEAEERKRLKRDDGGDSPPLTLEERIRRAAKNLERLVSDVEAARIDPLRRFVSARLTAAELRAVAAAHRDMRVYAVWQSARKSKLTHRSARVVKADAALTSFGADGDGITWAVLDTGIRGSHPHFKGLIKAVWDCTQRGAPKRIDPDAARDPDGHGTHVAGIITGRAPETDPPRKERGIAPRTKLIVYKVLDDNGESEDAWIIKALDHIAEQNENVAEGLAIHGLNLSLGGPFDSTVYGCGFSPICMELRRLWRAGVVVVVACGNEGLLEVSTPNGDTEIFSDMSIGDPANLEDCIAVGSINADKPHLYGVSAFSSRGPTADGRFKPDVVAPGERISSCNSRYRSEKDLYREDSGTSMAAPHVSGLIAAFLSVRREFRGRPDEVKKILLDTCVDLQRDRYHQGRGVPNLMQMLLTV